MKNIHPVFLLLIQLLFILKADAQVSASSDFKIKYADIAVVSIDDTEKIWPDYSYEPKATIHNSGKESCSFDVVMIIGQKYKSIKHFELNPGAAATLIFDSLVLEKGTYNFQTQINCDTDDNPVNNILSEKVIISEGNFPQPK